MENKYLCACKLCGKYPSVRKETVSSGHGDIDEYIVIYCGCGVSIKAYSYLLNGAWFLPSEDVVIRKWNTIMS